MTKTAQFAAAGSIFLLSAATMLLGVKDSDRKSSRTFAFAYDVSLKDLPADARTARVWIPVASSGAGQSVTLERVTGPIPTVETRDPDYGNHILFAEIPKPEGSTVHFRVNYVVTRREYGGQPDTADSAASDSVLRFLHPDMLVPIDGRMRDLAEEISHAKKNVREVARAIYDYVFTTLRYDKTGTGWGRGDAVWACDAKRGNCTDFHSLFIALMRAEKIPARFEIGFPLPEKIPAGDITGYHCWAEFHIDGEGWVPVDVSEAWKTPALRDFFFGHLDANRVQFTIGRDITLSPRQQGEPLNYFIYPYAEVNGKPYTAIASRFSFRDVSP